jgi:predicted site-specific integrase-resolvase
MEAVETVLKPFLTLREFAEYVGRSYGTVYDWATRGLIKTEQKGAKNKSYRVPVAEARAAKKRLEDGLWI